MFRKSLLVGFVAVLAFVPPASAWDGQRKGFILGLGLGPGFISFSQTIDDSATRENRGVFATDFKIGYAFNHRVLLYFNRRDAYFRAPDESDGRVMAVSNISALAASYYFQPEAPSFFAAGGIGISAWRTPFASEHKNRYGVGFCVGGGYEFSRNFSVDISLVGSNAINPVEEEMDVSYQTAALILTLNVMGY